MKRLITALALIVFAVYLIWQAPSPAFEAAAVLVGWLCYREFGNIVVAQGLGRPASTGIAIGISIIVFPQHILPIASLLLLVHLAALLGRGDLATILPHSACTFLGSFYAFAPWSFAFSLRQINPNLLFFALGINWVGDSAAFYAGRKFGRHKLAPRVSPGKSWEGSIASVVVSVLFGMVYLNWVETSLPLWATSCLALLANLAGQAGDLVESSLKRAAGVKDSGNLLPGHGGILDRLDSSMFSLPVTYILYIAAEYCLKIR